MASPDAAAAARMRIGGPTSTGAINPARAAVNAPASDGSSHGWTTAVGNGARPAHFATRPASLSCAVDAFGIAAQALWATITTWRMSRALPRCGMAKRETISARAKPAYSAIRTSASLL